MKILRDIPVWGASGQVERIVHAALVLHEGNAAGTCRELPGFMFLDEKPQ